MLEGEIMDDSANTSRETDALLEEALVAAAQEVVSVRAEAEAKAAELNAALDAQKVAFERAERQRFELEAQLSTLRAELESRPAQRPLEALLDELRPQLAAQDHAAHESAAQKTRALELEAAEAKRALNDVREAHGELTENHRVLLQQVESLEERFAETAAELRSQRERANALDEQRRSVERAACEVQGTLQEAQEAHALALQQAQDRAADELSAARDLSEKALAALRDEIRELQQALEGAREAGEQAQAEFVAELKQQLEAARAQAEQARAELTSELDGKLNEALAERQALAESSGKVQRETAEAEARLRADLETRDAELAALQALHADGLSERSALRTLLGAATVERDAVERAAELAAQSVQTEAGLRRDLAAAQADVEQAKGAVTELTAELEAVQAELKAAKDALFDKDRQLDTAADLQKKSAAQHGDLLAAREALAALEREKTALVEAHESLLADKDRLHHARLSDLEEQVEDAQRSAADAVARAEHAEQSLAAAEDRIRAELADELQEAGARAAAAEQALSQLKSTAAREVQVALESGHSREVELRKDLESSLRSLVELETALGKSQRQVTDLEAALSRAEKGTAELQGLWESSSAELDRLVEDQAGQDARVEALQNELLSVEQARTAERNALQAELDALIQTHDDVESASVQERRRLTQQVEDLEAELSAQAAQQRELEHLQAAYEALAIERDEERAAHERELSALLERSATADSGAHARPAPVSEANALVDLQRELEWMREDRAARLEAEAESKALWQRERDRVRELARELHELRAANLELRGRAATSPQTSEYSRGSLHSHSAVHDTPASEVVPIPRGDARSAAPAQDAEARRKRSERKERNKDRRVHSGTSYAVNDIQEEVVFRPLSQRPGGSRG